MIELIEERLRELRMLSPNAKDYRSKKYIIDLILLNEKILATLTTKRDGYHH